MARLPTCRASAPRTTAEDSAACLGTGVVAETSASASPEGGATAFPAPVLCPSVFNFDKTPGRHWESNGCDDSAS